MRVVACFAFAALTACASRPPPAPPAPAPAPPPPAGPAPRAAFAMHAMNDGASLPELLAGAAAAAPAALGPPGSADPNEAALAAATRGLDLAAEGPVARATLMEGRHASFTVTMQPGRCYAVVAHGSTIADLDVLVLAPPFYNFLAAQDGASGPTAIAGGPPGHFCPALPVPVTYKIDLFAKRGGGPVAARLYVRNH